METIKIQYLNDEIERLRYIDGKSDWIDLRAAEEVELKAGEFKLIHLGVAMQLPEGYEAHIVPRSSTFKNFGIIQTNHCGIIDESYCGPNDWFYMPAYALRDTVIHVNDRICQFRIEKHQPTISFEELAFPGSFLFYLNRIIRDFEFFKAVDEARNPAVPILLHIKAREAAP